MGRKILLSVMAEEIRLALLEDGQLGEYVVEREEHGHMAGNIYKGRIQNALPGMEAVFVDVGGEKNVFLHIGTGNENRHCKRDTSVKLTIGQEILLQIEKEDTGSKGPRGTLDITLPGRYLVLMPDSDYVGVSRKVEDPLERERLREIAHGIKPAGMGLIIRTNGEGKSREELERDMTRVLNTWQAVWARSKRVQAPALLYRDVDLVIRTVRDYITDEVDDIIIDQYDAYHRVLDLVQSMMPQWVEKVKHYTEKTDIFSYYRVDHDIRQIHEKKVVLPSGGYLVVDTTEALTVIDVNTGKFVHGSNLGDTIYKTNIEAVAAIAKVLRLRDIGGIIIVDFIDMAAEEQRQFIIEQLRRQLKGDRTKHSILGFTHLGLLEMTRKKVRRNVKGILYESCPCCQGEGVVRSAEATIMELFRSLRQMHRMRPSGQGLLVQAYPTVIEMLEKNRRMKAVEQELGREIRLEANAGLGISQFQVMLAGVR